MSRSAAIHVFLGLLWAQLALALVPSWLDGTYYSYGWLVLSACWCFYLVRRRDFPLPRRSRNRSAAVALLAFVTISLLCVVALRLFQGGNPYWRLVLWIHAILTLCVTAGLLAFHHGVRALRHHLPALVLILAAVPLPSALERRMIQGLTQSVVAVSSDLARGGGIPLEVTGTAFIVRGHPLDVNDRCSGIRSFQSCFAVALLVGELLHLLVPFRLLLLLVGALASFAGNIFRVLSLVRAYFDGGSTGLEEQHDFAGLLSVTLSYGLILAVGFLLERKSRGSQRAKVRVAPPRPPARDPRSAVADAQPGAPHPESIPAAALLVLSGLLVASELGRGWWLNPRETRWATAAIPTLDTPGLEKATSLSSRSIAGNLYTGSLRFDEADSRFLQGKHERGDAMAVLFLSYRANNRSLWTDLFTHPPELCMRSSGCVLEEKLPARALNMGDRPIPVRILKYRDPSNESSLFIFKAVWLPPESPIQPGDDVADLRGLWVSMAIHRIPHPPGTVLLVGIWGVEREDTAWDIFQRSVTPHVHLVAKASS